MPNFAINMALLNMGHDNMNNPDQKGEILYAMGQTVNDPNVQAISYQQHYFHCKTSYINIIKANTGKIKSPENSMQFAEIEYIITCRLSGDVSSINRNEVHAGDYIIVYNQPNIWYKVNKILEQMGGGQYSVVKAIQTSQDPEKANTNQGIGINNHNLLFGS